jgi:SHS2 domain-containing protein
MMEHLSSDKYKMIDHTADLGVIVCGITLKELFSNAAWSLFDIMTDILKIKPINKYKISLTANSTEELLVTWLGELIYLWEVKSMLFCQFQIREISPHKLAGYAIGEPYKPSQHPIYKEIKAATYHQLEVKKENDKWRAQIIFDV